MPSRYDAVLAALDAGVVIHAADTTILEANDRARVLLGLRDLEGRLATDPTWVFLESDRTPMALERFPVMQVLASRAPVRGLEMIICPPDDRETWLEVNAIPILDDHREVEQVAVTFIDVTPRALAETAMTRQAERLELVLASSRLGIWDWNMVTGAVVFDERWAEIVGYRLEELEPISIQTWMDLCHPDDLAASDALIEAHAEGRTPFYDAELRMRHRDGRWVWVHDRGRIVERTADGRPLRMTGTHADVTPTHDAARALANAEEELRLAFERSRVATCLVSDEGRLLRVNEAMCDLLGRPEADLLNLRFDRCIHPDDVRAAAEPLRDVVAGRSPDVRLSLRYITGSGRVGWGDATISGLRNPDGSFRHAIAQVVDTTAERNLRDALLATESISHIGGWQLDLASGQVTWSPELFALFGLAPAATAPDLVDQEGLFTPESWARLSAAIARTQDTGSPYLLELEFVRGDGTHRWMEARGGAVRDAGGTVVELRGTAADITDRKAAEESLRSLATHDPLTGLANRVALLEEITRAVTSGRRTGRATAVVLIDLDRFKAINDALGHGVGDQLLVAAAGRLTEVVRGSDLVARLGGDEFVIVMRDLTEPAEAVWAAERIVRTFRAPFTVADRELFSTVSAGVTIAASDSQPEDLLREADTAMYAAKESGRDRASTYNEDLRTAVTTRLAIEADLRHAAEREQLAVWYQPEVELATGRIVAVEALLRWHHRDGTVWTADRFVEIAEDTGLILDMGDWVLRQACLDAAGWARSRPDRPLTVRVNVSAVQLAEAGLIEAIDDALAASGLDPTLLCVEITETALLRTTAITHANLEALHARGVSLAIDDFGTGYASLTYLHQYPVDVIKIDRSFMTDVDQPGGLVAGIVALARTLGIAVTAEGVETPAQAAGLHAFDCPTAQGWLYSAAVPAEDITGLLAHVYPHPWPTGH